MATKYATDEELTKAGATLYGTEYWGISRHELIAGAAARLLERRASAEVTRILAPLGAQTSLLEIAGWADQIKGRSAEDGGDPDTIQFLTDFPNDASRDWHYVNLPLGVENYAVAAQLGFTRDDDVVHMLGESARVLQGNSNIMSKLNALRWVVHLVGDIHQPIHVGCGFVSTTDNVPRLVHDPQQIIQNNLKHDRGGNNLVLPVSGAVSLHSYWDSRLEGNIDEHADEHADEETPDSVTFAVRTDDSTSQELKDRFINKLVRMVERDKAVRSSAAAPANVTPHDQWAEQWANNSLAEAREAYKSLSIVRRLSGGKFKVSWEGKATYDTRCRPIVSQNLTSAAQHLADLLNATWP